MNVTRRGQGKHSNTSIHARRARNLENKTTELSEYLETIHAPGFVGFTNCPDDVCAAMRKVDEPLRHQ